MCLHICVFTHIYVFVTTILKKRSVALERSPHGVCTCIHMHVYVYTCVFIHDINMCVGKIREKMYVYA